MFRKIQKNGKFKNYKKKRWAYPWAWSPTVWSTRWKRSSSPSSSSPLPASSGWPWCAYQAVRQFFSILQNLFNFQHLLINARSHESHSKVLIYIYGLQKMIQKNRNAKTPTATKPIFFFRCPTLSTVSQLQLSWALALPARVIRSFSRWRCWLLWSCSWWWCWGWWWRWEWGWSPCWLVSLAWQ